MKKPNFNFKISDNFDREFFSLGKQNSQKNFRYLKIKKILIERLKENLQLKINNSGVKWPSFRAPKFCTKLQEHRGKQLPNVNKKSITIAGEREDHI